MREPRPGYLRRATAYYWITTQRSFLVSPYTCDPGAVEQRLDVMEGRSKPGLARKRTIATTGPCWSDKSQIIQDMWFLKVGTINVLLLVGTRLRPNAILFFIKCRAAAQGRGRT